VFGGGAKGWSKTQSQRKPPQAFFAWGGISGKVSGKTKGHQKEKKPRQGEKSPLGAKQKTKAVTKVKKHCHQGGGYGKHEFREKTGGRKGRRWTSSTRKAKLG